MIYRIEVQGFNKRGIFTFIPLREISSKSEALATRTAHNMMLAYKVRYAWYRVINPKGEIIYQGTSERKAYDIL